MHSLKLFSHFEQIAALNIDVDILNNYYWEGEEKSQFPLPMQPIPKLDNLLMNCVVLNTTRLCFRHFGIIRGAEQLYNFPDYYGDEMLVDACIHWLNFPLPALPKSNANSWKFPLLSGCERIMHIGRRDQSLNMGQIQKFVKSTIEVRVLFNNNLIKPYQIFAFVQGFPWKQ